MTLSIKRGDVVIVDFTSMDANAGTRPALVAQNDRDNARMDCPWSMSSMPA